jgi:predicted phage tail protein
MAPPLAGDKAAGFTGLVVGAVILGAALYTIVHLTNVHYANLHESTPAAAESH